MIPVTFVLIDNYIDRPVADAIGSGVILLAFRLLETAGALAVLLGLSVMMNKLSRSFQNAVIRLSARARATG
jgi:hypothetical protein